MQAIGGSVNESKARISELKALIEQRRIQRAVAAGDLSGGGGAATEAADDDPEEARCRAHIERVGSGLGGRGKRDRGEKKERLHNKSLLSALIECCCAYTRQAGVQRKDDGRIGKKIPCKP